jgi:hypothetical protein
MAITPTQSFNIPSTTQADRASAQRLRVSRRMEPANAAKVQRRQATARRDPAPTVGQHIDKILSKAEKALFSLLFSEEQPAVTEAAPAAPVAAAKPARQPKGPALGRLVDIRG